MIDFYYCPAVNGHKVRIALEEMALPYTIVPTNISKGDQLKPDYLKISPNNKMPAIVDHDPPGGGAPVSCFESGAILIYLAEKSGMLLPTDLRARLEVLKWVFWQTSGLGPMAGQSIHFREYAPDDADVTYPRERYTREAGRLYAVLDRQLQGKQWVAGDDYSIADIMAYPWTLPCERTGNDVDAFPNLKAWMQRMAARPAVARAYELAQSFGFERVSETSGDSWKRLFAQSAADVAR